MKKNKLALPIIAMVIGLMSCAKEPVYNTDHPEHGKITLTTLWQDRGDNIDIPADYTIQVGDYSATLRGATNSVDNLFLPGQYTILVYNKADNISINGTTVTANYQTGRLGWLFTGTNKIDIEKDKVHQLTVDMHQQVRQLTLIIEPKGETADKIDRITASLSGVAATLNMDNNTLGTSSNVTMEFTKSEDNKWVAVVSLLGIMGAEQKLSGTIVFKDGSPGNIALSSDLTTALNNFNSDKKTSFALGGEIVAPTGIGFGEAIIKEWQQQGKIDGEAEYQ